MLLQIPSARKFFPRVAPFPAKAGPVGKNAEQPAFGSRINRKLSLLLTFIFIVVLIIGAISLLLARSNYLTTKEIEKQIAHIEAIDAVHLYVHRLAFAIQESIITQIPFPEDDRAEIIANLRQHLDHYLEMEQGEEFPEKEQEMKIFARIRKLVTELFPTTERLSKAVTAGKEVDDGDLKYLTYVNMMIPILALDQNKIHQVKIDRSMADSRNRMSIILGFYLAFIIIGSLLIFGSNVLFQKTIVQPIHHLVSATTELAKGDFRKRVTVESQNEIGQLAHSFNMMAERLEEHEALVQVVATREERERIAQELHDSIAQDLGLIHVKLGEAEMSLARTGSTAADEPLREMRKIADGAYENVRHAIFGLRTKVFKGLGFIPALTEYLHDFSEITKIPVALKMLEPEAVRFSPLEEIQLIRIIHEALANVFKHAQATKAAVTFERDGNFSKTVIEDDGKGFIVEPAVNKRLHFGLETMRERAERARGKLFVDSAPGKGTRVIVHLPLE